MELSNENSNEYQYQHYLLSHYDAGGHDNQGIHVDIDVYIHIKIHVPVDEYGTRMHRGTDRQCSSHLVGGSHGRVSRQ